jgi:hypothetical protein
MLSLVMFQSDYVSRLIELGEADAVARIDDIRRFLRGDGGDGEHGDGGDGEHGDGGDGEHGTRSTRRRGDTEGG